jgi:hypothetical protein
MRRAARIDDNQRAIVNALRAVGASVEIIARPVDLLVGYRQATFLLEVKDGTKVASAKGLTPLQEKFFRNWRGGPALKVESVDEALAAIGASVRAG